MKMLLFLLGLAAILGSLTAGLLVAAKSPGNKKKGSNWGSIQENIGIPVVLLVLFLGWWLLTKNSEASWALPQAWNEVGLWVGFSFLALTSKLLAIPKAFKERFDRKLLLAGSISVGVLVLVWTLFSWPENTWTKMTTRASITPTQSVRLAAILPTTNRDCRLMPSYPDDIPAQLAARDTLEKIGSGNYRLIWTAAMPVYSLKQGMDDWPSSGRIRVLVTPIRGHFDIGAKWNASSEMHAQAPVGRPRGLDYCRNTLFGYSLPQNLLHKSWPLALALVANIDDPNTEVWNFNGMQAREIVVDTQQDPKLVFVNNNPNGNGRLHAVTFLIDVSIVP